jgi:hypothetical protein
MAKRPSGLMMLNVAVAPLVDVQRRRVDHGAGCPTTDQRSIAPLSGLTAVITPVASAWPSSRDRAGAPSGGDGGNSVLVGDRDCDRLRVDAAVAVGHLHRDGVDVIAVCVGRRFEIR